MNVRLVETLAAAATLTAAVAYVMSSWTHSPTDMVILASAWGVWLGARHATSEYMRYALALGLLLPAAFVVHAVSEQGASPVLLALPPLARAAMLSSLPSRIRNGCMLMARDAKWIAGGSRGRPADGV